MKPFYTAEFCKSLTIDTSTCETVKDRAQLLANQLNAKLEREGKVVVNHPATNVWLTDVVETPGYKPDPDTRKALLINPEPIK